MATDSTELTFVRCPHCRSLVPAMSKVCRMCGEPLDSGAKADDSDQRKSSRIRQRTMSRGNDELSATAARIREEMSPAEPAPSDPVDLNNDDPLGAYIEEVEAVDEAPTSKVAALVEPDAAQEKSEPEDFSSEAAEDVPVPEKLEHIAEEHVWKTGPTHEIEESEQELASDGGEPSIVQNGSLHGSKQHELVHEPRILSQDQPQPEKIATPREPFAHSEPAVPSELSSRPRVLVESGSRKTMKSGGLSFSRAKDAAQADPSQGPSQAEDLPANNHSVVTSAKAFEPVSPRVANTRPLPGVASPSAAPKVMEPVLKASPSAAHEEGRGSPVQREDRRAAPQEQRAALRPPVQSSQECLGRLFGWLVSYINPNGEAIELRECKFFVSRTSLKASDLILDDESVSTPHAMVSVSSVDGLRVQDLMSERGVFVRRKAGDSYQRVSDVIQLQHGDWLRIGDVEFLVSLIAHVGVE